MAIFLPAHAWNLVVPHVPRAWGPARRTHCFFDANSPVVVNVGGPWRHTGVGRRESPVTGYLISIPESGAGGSVRLEFRAQAEAGFSGSPNVGAVVIVSGLERWTVIESPLDRHIAITLTGLPASPLIRIGVWPDGARIGSILLRATNAGAIQHMPAPGNALHTWTTPTSLIDTSSDVVVRPSPRTQVLRPVGGGGLDLDPASMI